MQSEPVNSKLFQSAPGKHKAVYFAFEHPVYTLRYDEIRSKNIYPPEILSNPNQPQPEPWMAMVLVDNSAFIVSMLPKDLSIAEHNSLLGFDEPGLRFFQKIEWFKWPPPLNLRAGNSEIAVL